MPDWRSQYLANLHEAELRNPVNKDLVAACSQLADRVASLEAEKAVLLQSSPAQPKTTSSGSTPSSADSSDPTIAQLRLDLAEALRAKGQLQTKFKNADAELQKLRSKSKVDDKRIHDLTTERNSLTSKLRDRNEEVVGKTRLLKDVQDDNLTLNIQLDVRENDLKKLKSENKELVDRWMRKMEKEAEAMNLANEPQTNGRKR
ncbi:putative Autophagy-related protein 16 [Seiridium cardinale]|uniref:Autophagy-related protein 16 n=1 Tax=Seiridium cardinale TaxID=138064 RepID=A0ABR2Y6T5_9PEZI